MLNLYTKLLVEVANSNNSRGKDSYILVSY